LLLDVDAIRTGAAHSPAVPPEEGSVSVSLGELAKTFLRIGATSYGGPAIVAQIREVTVLQKRWLTEDEFRESLAFAQMLPGPIAVATAAHAGWRLHGGIGTFVAMVSYISPAFLLMLGLSAGYFHFEGMPSVTTAFRGLGAAVVAIVVQSIVSMAQPALRNWQGLAIAAAAAAGFFVGADSLLVLLAAGIAGVLVGLVWPGIPGPTAEPRPSTNGAVSYRRTLLATTAVALAFVVALSASRLISPRFPPLGVMMAKINLVAFGGGYTAIALMFHDVVHDPATASLTSKEFIDGLALGQITPGPVSITATFIGYRVGGVLGAAFATVCIFLPSSLLLVLLAPHFARLRGWRAVQDAVGGLLAAFIAMLLHVLAEVAKSAFMRPWDVALAVAAIAALQLRVNVVWVVLAAIALSFLFMR
jgi:chromate transporter